MKPEFPIVVKLSDGDEWRLANESEIPGTLEWFDTEDPEEDALVVDAKGREVSLKVVALEVVRCQLK